MILTILGYNKILVLSVLKEGDKVYRIDNKDIDYENSTIDMASIRTNDNGDFVFTVSFTTYNNKSHRYKGIIQITNKLIDKLSEWYGLRWNVNTQSTYQFLSQILETGRDKWLENHPQYINFEEDLYRFNIVTTDIQTIPVGNKTISTSITQEFTISEI